MGDRFGALFYALALTSCAGAVQAPPADSTEPATCEAAYNTLVRLGCPEAGGPATMSWLEFCRMAEQSEGAIYIRVACIARAPNVESIRECRVRCKK
jgi:hypothetical protein